MMSISCAVSKRSENCAWIGRAILNIMPGVWIHMYDQISMLGARHLQKVLETIFLYTSSCSVHTKHPSSWTGCELADL